MIFPLLMSVPHAGVSVPPEVEELCILKATDIQSDSDEGAAEIYLSLQSQVSAFVTTDVARTIIDMNRAENDRSKDGIVKTHTCWNVPIYRAFPSEAIIETLMDKYYRPYHANLSRHAENLKLGIDCHTMAPNGPPVGPDPGKQRPLICLSNAGFTCPPDWLTSLAASFEKTFETKVSLNVPFKGGYIIRSHARELPWVQLELSRSDSLSNAEKSRRVIAALKHWCRNGLD